jgi:hypothetical protein
MRIPDNRWLYVNGVSRGVATTIVEISFCPYIHPKTQERSDPGVGGSVVLEASKQVTIMPKGGKTPKVVQANAVSKGDYLLDDSIDPWPPLKPGTRVRTLAPLHDKEYLPEALEARCWGATGTIKGHHDSHGLCYDVKHDGLLQGTGCYDPDEIEVI